MWKIFSASFLVFLMAETQASPGDYCIDVSDCDSGECCQILSPMQIASRKRGSGGNSTCQRYQRLGESCNPFDKWNGYCSCEPGTRCTYHPPLTSPPHIVTPPPPTTPGFPETSPTRRPTTPPDTPPTPGIPETSPPTPTTPYPSTPPPGIPETSPPVPTTPYPSTPPPGIPETSPPVPTTPYPSTPPPGSTTLVYPDTTTTSPDDPPCGRKKRALIAGATYDCQPI